MNERETCKQLIGPALRAAGWIWDEKVRIGPRRVNLSGPTMDDDGQAIYLDYLLRLANVPLVALEAKGRGPIRPAPRHSPRAIAENL
jgi:type I restriction enzyme, R subunit